jgi:hypothetical protein
LYRETYKTLKTLYLDGKKPAIPADAGNAFLLYCRAVRSNAGAEVNHASDGDFSGLSLEIKVVIGAGTPGKEEES